MYICQLSEDEQKEIKAAIIERLAALNIENIELETSLLMNEKISNVKDFLGGKL